MDRYTATCPEPTRSNGDYGTCQEYLHVEKQVLAARPHAMIPDQGSAMLSLGFKQLQNHLSAIGDRLEQQSRKGSDGDQGDPLRLLTFRKLSLLVFVGSILHTLGCSDNAVLIRLKPTVLEDVVADEYHAMLKAFPKSEELLESFFYSSVWGGYSKLGTTDAESKWLLECCNKWARTIVTGGNPVFKVSYNAIKTAYKGALARIINQTHSRPQLKIAIPDSNLAASTIANSHNRSDDSPVVTLGEACRLLKMSEAREGEK